MSEFLSDEWVTDLATAAGDATVPRELNLVVQQIVLLDDGAEVAFAVRVRHGEVRVESGRASDADVSFTQDLLTATAIARGDLSAQSAFLSGALRVGGDLRSVIQGARALDALEDIFAEARATTMW